MKRILFIYNPCSGKGKISAHLSEIMQRLSEDEIEVVVHATKRRLEAKEVACAYAKEGLCDRIICAGGDGTMNEVTSGVMESGKRIPIGLIPAGSTNDFGYTLGIPESIADAAVFAATHEYAATDIASLNGNYFTYTAAFGAFAGVSYDTPQAMKNALGHLAYLLNGVTELGKIKPYRVRLEYNDKVIEDDFIFGTIVSSNSIGGFRGLPGDGVEVNDGLHEMIFVRNPKTPVGLAKAVNELLHHKFDEAQYIIRERVSRVKVITDEKIAWSLDGEFGGETTVADIVVEKGGVDYVRI